MSTYFQGFHETCNEIANFDAFVIFKSQVSESSCGFAVAYFLNLCWHGYNVTRVQIILQYTNVLHINQSRVELFYNQFTLKRVWCMKEHSGNTEVSHSTPEHTWSHFISPGGTSGVNCVFGPLGFCTRKHRQSSLLQYVIGRSAMEE